MATIQCLYAGRVRSDCLHCPHPTPASFFVPVVVVPCLGQTMHDTILCVPSQLDLLSWGCQSKHGRPSQAVPAWPSNSVGRAVLGLSQ